MTERLSSGDPFQSQEIFYDAFGEPRGEWLADDAVRARYTGRPYDPETGLSYHRSRYLVLDAGRWLSEDRWWTESGDANRYRYVNNSPMQYTDPSGAYALPVVGAIAVYAARAIGLSAIETGAEAALARSVGDRQFTTQIVFGRNLAVNLAIGWVPGLTETKVGLRASTIAGRAVGAGVAQAAVNFGGRVTIGTVGDAAWSIGVEEQSLRAGITQAFVGNLVGQSLGSGLRYGARSWAAARGGTVGIGEVGDVTSSQLFNILDNHFIPNTAAGNKLTAFEFYTKEANFSSIRAMQHIDGIDFTRPVTPVTISYGATAQQFVGARGPGRYFAPVGSSPLQSGIPATGQFPTMFQSIAEVCALQSYTRPDYIYPPGGVVPGSGTGGGLQYFVPEPHFFVPISR
ncbi:MAG: hypothetical protein O2931_13130 [Planctomycetota bacterium]|nr:hypothetical protein [Planctomycetota bacterium]MDA1179727.1 hypothetical protein [Planctomycetota bacterium]